ncbi:MAG TPA: hypothetical protein VKB23_02825 [Solirubrobacterales bacterium]|nr:hypothetical protein [Solirubrobacterales bacterium]
MLFAKLANQRQPLVLQLPDPLSAYPEFFAYLFLAHPLAHHPRAHPQDMSDPIIYYG